MKQLKLRFAAPEESPQIIEWLNRHQAINKYSPEVLNDRSLRVLCSYDDSGPQQYGLISRVLMLDSFAPSPGISPLNAAQSFRDMTKAALLLASGEGVKSIYALDMDGGLAAMAVNHHYELVGERKDDGQIKPFCIYRIKV